jgi:hypothetical protein
MSASKQNVATTHRHVPHFLREMNVVIKEHLEQFLSLVVAQSFLE